MAPNFLHGPPLVAASQMTTRIEDAILTYVPTGLALFATPVLFLQYAHRPVVVRSDRLLWLKLSFAAFIIILEMSSLVLRSSSADFFSRGGLATSTVDLIVALSIAATLVAEHRHATRSSALLGIYLALAATSDGTKSRCYMRISTTQSLGYLYATSALGRLLLLLLTEFPYGRHAVSSSQRRLLAERYRGFWTRTLVLWLNSTLALGFHTVLTDNDLGPLDDELSSQVIFRRFDQRWQEAEKTAKDGLAIICLKSLQWPLLSLALPRLVFSLVSFRQPFMLRDLLIAIQTDDLSANEQDSLMTTFMLVFGAIAITRAAHRHMSGRLVTTLRAILTGQVLRKSQALAQIEAKKSAAMSLMSTDIEGLVSSVPILCEIPFNLLEVILGMSCLALFVGEACLIVLIPLCFSVSSGTFFGKRAGTAMAAWNEHILRRVSETSKILAQMKVIRMMGLGPTMTVYLQRLRDDEISASRNFFGVSVLIASSRMLASAMAPVLVVGAGLFWTSLPKNLSATETFPCLAIVGLIQKPLYSLINASSLFSAMLASFNRIQEYLGLEENADERILTSATGATASDDFQTPVIEFVEVTLASPESEKEILREASFAIQKGSISAALGPSGAGKSTMLRSIVGDAHIVDGFIYVDNGIIGFADQSPWIRNVSIRENIIGRLMFDAARYTMILSVCLLLEDLERLPGGDRYVAGVDGMNLSGGQRSRVGLARALYCEASTLVIDDIFSSLDRRTAVAILYQLCGQEGLLRQSGCTVIIATHLAECLDVVDQLLLLDGCGNVTVETNFQEERFREELTKALHVQAPVVPIEKEDQEKASIQRSLESTEVAESSVLSSLPSNRYMDWHTYAFLINSVGKRTFAAWVFLVLLVSVSETVPDIFIRIWISLAPHNMRYFSAYTGAAIFAAIICGITQTLLHTVLAPRSASSLHMRLSRTVMQSTLGFFSSVETGSIMVRYSEDMNSLMRELPGAVYRFLYMLFHVILQVAVILSGSAEMVRKLPHLLIPTGILVFFYLRTSRQLRRMQLEAKTPLYNHFVETANGLRHIRALHWESNNLAVGLDLLDASQRPTYMTLCTKRWLSLAVDLLVCYIGTSLMSIALRHRDTAYPPGVGLSYLILITFGKTLMIFVDHWGSLDSLVSALSKLRLFIQHTPVESENDEVQLPPHWPRQGDVQLNNVTARYGSDGPATLQNVSLHVAAGAKVGIMGRTGSGKSSLFMSMLGFLSYKGSIIIDGVDISTIPRDTLRSRIITISQDALDLGGSVRNNLLPFYLNSPAQRGNVSDADITDALRRVGLLSLISMHGGVDTKLSKVGLSHGQLQLLSIARAILRCHDTQGKVVLMDEATSNVDLETDAVIQKVLRESFAGCTILMIAHRLETIQDADLFVELNRGTASIVKH